MSNKQRIASARVRGQGPAGGGTWTFIGQRGSALVLLALAPWFALAAPLAARGGYEGLRDFLASPVHAIAVGVLVVAAALHMWIGVMEIVEDYIHKPFGKFALLSINIIVCAAAAGAGVVALYALAMGA